ncbi:hypothetical protein OE88DRAFT_1662367 [Heliocybe sulcata]|uniref:ABM domain-containing protein n=1 Tax=Heliocybe sulcata TaxID=5364 RepID=A0A5C3MY07_9AGAM|nr:hypothetical protein OE88DRAFT_1662367 [Heliocybe sulcata]
MSTTSYVTELVVFDASEAYQKDNKAAQGLVDVLNKTDGKIATWHGPGVEDPTKGYLWVRWESLDAHKALMDSPTYPDLIASMKPCLAGEFEMVHVKFNKDPLEALNAPATEVVTVTLKEGKSEVDITAFLEQGSKMELPGASASAYGPVVEKPGSFIMIVGWSSVEAHQKVREERTEEAAKVLAGVLQIADIKVAHAKLTKY